jgi:hypothetical protein
VLAGLVSVLASLVSVLAKLVLGPDGIDPILSLSASGFYIRENPICLFCTSGPCGSPWTKSDRMV